MAPGLALFMAALPAVAAAQPEPARLPDVEVSAARGLAPLGLLPLAITRLDSLPPAGTGPLALAELLRGIPGVVSIDQGNPAVDERLAIRGFGSRSAFGVRGVTVLLDGVPQTLPDGQGQLTDVDPGAVTAVEVLRGGAAAFQGNAAGGVVALESGLLTGATGLTTVAEGGSFGSWRVGADGAARVGDVRVAGGGGWQARDGWRDHASGESRRLRFGLRAPAGPAVEALATLRFTDQPDALNPGGLTAAELATDPTAAAPANVAANARKSVRQWQGSAALQGSAWSATVFGLRREVDNPLPFATILLDRWSGGLRLEARHALGGAPAPLLVAGLDAQWMRDERRNRDPDGVLVLDQVDRVRGLGPFAALRLPLSAEWLATAGLRWDHARFSVSDRFLADGDDAGEVSFGQLSPALGVTWLAGPAVAAWASVRSSFETPTTTELVNRPDGSAGLATDLEPQRAWHAEAGARGRAGAVGWEVAAFVAWIEDLLVPYEDPANPGRRYFRNAGRARHAGLELAGRWAAAERLALSAGWAWLDARYTAYDAGTANHDGNRLPGVPAHRATLGAELQAPHDLALAADFTASSGLWVDDANSARSDAWATLDLRLWWEGPGGLTPWLTIRNLFDAATVLSVIVNAAAGRFYEPGPGRAVVVGMRWGDG